VSNQKQKFKNMLEFGIDLGISSEEEEIFYAREFAQYVQDSLDFDSIMKSENVIDIYSSEEMVISVIIQNGVLMLEPNVEDGAFEAVLLVLKFVSEMHDDVKDRFKSLSIEEASDISEEESEDDSEWI
jgi:hypothetical protein